MRPTLSILVAEDNPVNQMLISTLLEKDGHDVTVVPSGREAVESVQNNAYDVVFMDVEMENMDGLEATRAIRGLGRHDLPIIALTANALHGDEERCLASGMNDYLTKPFSARSLIEKMERWTAAKPVAS